MTICLFARGHRHRGESGLCAGSGKFARRRRLSWSRFGEARRCSSARRDRAWRFADPSRDFRETSLLRQSLQRPVWQFAAHLRQPCRRLIVRDRTAVPHKTYIRSASTRPSAAELSDHRSLRDCELESDLADKMTRRTNNNGD